MDQLPPKIFAIAPKYFVFLFMHSPKCFSSQKRCQRNGSLFLFTIIVLTLPTLGVTLWSVFDLEYLQNIWLSLTEKMAIELKANYYHTDLHSVAGACAK